MKWSSTCTTVRTERDTGGAAPASSSGSSPSVSHAAPPVFVVFRLLVVQPRLRDAVLFSKLKAVQLEFIQVLNEVRGLQLPFTSKSLDHQLNLEFLRIGEICVQGVLEETCPW